MTFQEALEIVVARTKHERFRQLCDPTHPDYNQNYENIVLGMVTAEPQTATQAAVPIQSPQDVLASIPLAGDVVEAIAKRFGVDKVAAYWEELTGIPCGCSGRKELLNRASAQLLEWFGLGQ